MKKQGVLLALTNAVQGRDEEYNTWYNQRHLVDILKVPGITAAKRYRLSGAQPSDGAWKYLAIYEIDTDDLNSVVQEIKRRWGTDVMPLTDALADKRLGWYFEKLAISPSELASS